MQPPKAKRIPVQTTLHGDTRTDPYAWLHEKNNPDVKKYLQAENAYLAETMSKVKPLQDTLYKNTIARIQETDQDPAWPYGPYEYYSRTVKDQEHEIFCRKRKGTDDEEVLFDENEHAAPYEYFDVGTYALSIDQSWLAITIDTAGDERYDLWIKNLKTGELFIDKLTDIANTVTFTGLNHELWYSRFDEAHRPYQVYCHDILSSREDTLVYQEDDERFWVGFYRCDSDAYMMIQTESKLTSEVHYISAETPREKPLCFLPRSPGHEYDLDHHGQHFYIRSNDKAKNFCLMRCDINNTTRDSWVMVIPHDINVCLEGCTLFKRNFCISERLNGQSSLRIYDPATGKDYRIPFDEACYSVGLSDNWEYDTDIIRFSYCSLTTPESTYDFNMKTQERVLVKTDPVLGGYDSQEYATERLLAPAPDGTMVPISLVYRKDKKQDLMPCYIAGYGSYGITVDPWFSYSRISLLDEGFVFAIAHIRGGGECGEPWHDAGKLKEKHHTFEDFITCSEYLISKRYTAADRLYISGGSAGGLLMGAVINMRPDLFRGVVAHVPFVDVLNTMLDHTLPLTIGEYEEWGNPNNEEDYHIIKAYSPYDNVRPQPYPALFVTAGLNDPRVSYWEAAKWVAKLRDTSTGTQPLLFKINMSAGHQGLSGRYHAIKEACEEFAFVLGVQKGMLG
jgi:oligopeptidase B